MKAFWTIAIAGLGALTVAGSVSAQPYGGRDYGYGDRDGGYRDRDGGYRERSRGYDDRDDGGRGRDRGYRDRDNAFNEREYLRCNPDVRQALSRGQITSAAAHYQKFGRREGRRLSC